MTWDDWWTFRIEEIKKIQVFDDAATGEGKDMSEKREADNLEGVFLGIAVIMIVGTICAVVLRVVGIF